MVETTTLNKEKEGQLRAIIRIIMFAVADLRADSEPPGSKSERGMRTHEEASLHFGGEKILSRSFILK